MTAPLLAAIDVTGFRSLRRVEVAPRQLCALVGDARAGKSNFLAAVRAVLAPGIGADPSDVPALTGRECGGKWNIPLFARICRAAGVPFVAVYDTDAGPGHKPSPSNRAIAAKIRALTGPEHTVELSPDFEGVAGMQRGGHGKPERAWRRFASLTAEQLPASLVRVAELATDLARDPSARTSAEAP